MLTLIALAAALQQTPTQPTGTNTPAPSTASAPARRPAASSALSNIEVHVVDRSGKPASGAHVVAEGPSSRDGMADLTGALMFRSMAAGTYRIRAEADGFISLEKEVSVRGTVPAIEFALSGAPPPPKVEAAPAPAPPPVVSPQVQPGEPRVLSLLDLAENSLGGRDPVRTVPIGCSGLSRAQLLVVRDSLPASARADADDMLYVIAGEAAITLGGKTQNVTSGWLSVVPRGTARAIVRKGKNPVILLSVVGGPNCADAATAQ